MQLCEKSGCGFIGWGNPTSGDNASYITWSGTSSEPVVTNKLPVVTVTSPKEGAIFALNASIPITATATDADGKVAKVVFFCDAKNLGSITASPYTLTYKISAAGEYSLFCQVTDDKGSVGESNVVNIRIGATTSVSRGAVAKTSHSGMKQLSVINNAFAQNSSAYITINGRVMRATHAPWDRIHSLVINPVAE